MFSAKQLGKLFKCGGACVIINTMDQLSSLPPTNATIGRWSVDRYINILRWPVIIGLAAALGLALLRLNQNWQMAAWVIVLISVSWQIKRQGGQNIEALTAGAVTGAALGLGSSVGQMIDSPTMLALANIVSDTALTAIAGALVTTAALITIRIFSR